MKKIVINGKFFSQSITGVQRYAFEILLELDKLIDRKTLPVILLVPKSVSVPVKYKNIRVVHYGNLKGTLWEQIELPMFCFLHDGISLNLCNPAPIIKPDIVTIHDISPVINKKWGDLSFRIWYRFMLWFIVYFSKKIITVSNFSKSAILNYYHVSSKKLIVVGNAWQHMNRIKDDDAILKKYSDYIKPKEYFFSLKSMSPNKNIAWIAHIAKQNPSEIFVLTGGKPKNVSEKDVLLYSQPNMKYLGYLKDEELKVLMKNCKAFIFPSFYEGFGIPPLEALSTGADIIISDRASLPEVFEKSAIYIDPYRFDYDLSSFDFNTADIQKNKDRVLSKYSWKKSANQILVLLKNILK